MTIFNLTWIYGFKQRKNKARKQHLDLHNNTNKLTSAKFCLCLTSKVSCYLPLYVQKHGRHYRLGNIFKKKYIIGLEFHTIGNPALIICPQWYAIQRRLMCFCFFFWCVLWKNPWLEPKQATIFLFYFLNIGHCCSVFLHINWQHPSPELPLAYIDKATHMV